jgi:very-short-patch-repair endonuclease
MSPRNDTDHQIAALATSQHGPVAHRQLRALGLSHGQIAYRLRVGRLTRWYPEVYVVGHRVLPREGRWMAAVLACGEGAVLSHFDAAAHHGLMANRGSRIHVTRPSTGGRAPDPRRIRLHRVGTFRPWEGALTEGMPTTTPARTLLDLSAHLRPRQLEDVIAQTDRRGLFDLRATTRCLDEHPRQPGASALRRLLALFDEQAPTDARSALEVAFLQLCDDHQLPRPEANRKVGEYVVDFLWPQERLAVETDGYAYHSTPSAFAADRLRDQHLTLAGYTVLRFTHQQVTRTPEAVANRLRRVLRART